jgi:transposase
MNFSIRHRIEKLEAIDMRLAKRIVWENGSGSAEREIARTFNLSHSTISRLKA